MHKKHILLDLDNTLLSAEMLEGFPLADKDIKEKATYFDFHDMDGYYIVFERPGVQEFLDYLFENFKVSVWTAASKSYCMFIIDNIIMKNPNRKLEFIFFSYHCSLSKAFYNRDSKKLDLLWNEFSLDDIYHPEKTLIIDDHPDVFKSQEKRCLHIKAFNFMDRGSERDNVLMENIVPLLEKFNKGEKLPILYNIGDGDEDDISTEKSLDDKSSLYSFLSDVSDEDNRSFSDLSERTPRTRDYDDRSYDRSYDYDDDVRSFSDLSERTPRTRDYDDDRSYDYDDDRSYDRSFSDLSERTPRTRDYDDDRSYDRSFSDLSERTPRSRSDDELTDEDRVSDILEKYK